MIELWLEWLAELFKKPVPKVEVRTFIPWPGVPDHACFNRKGGYRCDVCFGPIVCHGEPVDGIPPEKYATPANWQQCKNFRTKGPTPCWYPSCVINEAAHGHE